MRHAAICLLIGSGGMLILGIQPLLLGGLVDAHVLRAESLGWTATSEVLAMALGVILAPMLLRQRRPMPVVFAAGLLMTIGNVATVHADATASVVLVRSVAGFAEGIMVAVAVLFATYSDTPGRVNAAFLTVSAVPQLLLAYVLPTALFPRFGFRSGFYVMGAVGLVCTLLSFGLSTPLTPRPPETRHRVTWSPLIIVSLAGVFATASAIGACWSYADQIAERLGLSPQQVGISITTSLIFQTLGSALVAAVGWRLPFKSALICGAVAQAVTVTCMLWFHGFMPFVTGISVFGFLWQACFPFTTDLMVSVDPSRQSAPLTMPVTLVGLSAGPLMASFFVDTHVTGALVLSGVVFGAAALIYWIVLQTLAHRSLNCERAHG